MSHTPGPWTAFYKAKYDEWHVSVPTGGAGSMKLALFSDGLEGPEDDRETNARLIAAAPDLLAALKAFLAFDGHDDFEDEWPAARAAVAKAEGR